MIVEKSTNNSWILNCPTDQNQIKSQIQFMYLKNVHSRTFYNGFWWKMKSLWRKANTAIFASHVQYLQYGLSGFQGTEVGRAFLTIFNFVFFWPGLSIRILLNTWETLETFLKIFKAKKRTFSDKFLNFFVKFT